MLLVLNGDHPTLAPIDERRYSLSEYLLCHTNASPGTAKRVPSAGKHWPDSKSPHPRAPRREGVRKLAYPWRREPTRDGVCRTQASKERVSNATPKTPALSPAPPVTATEQSGTNWQHVSKIAHLLRPR